MHLPRFSPASVLAALTLHAAPALPIERHDTGPGRRTLRTYYRDYGKKWDGAALRKIRARNGVGRPPKRI